MNDFTLWIVYAEPFEKWANITRSLVEQHSSVSIELVLYSDERCTLYGIDKLPCLVAVKYNQPFRKLYGKHEEKKYIEWLEGLNWLNK